MTGFLDALIAAVTAALISASTMINGTSPPDRPPVGCPNPPGNARAVNETETRAMHEFGDLRTELQLAADHDRTAADLEIRLRSTGNTAAMVSGCHQPGVPTPLTSAWPGTAAELAGTAVPAIWAPGSVIAAAEKSADADKRADKSGSSDHADKHDGGAKNHHGGSTKNDDSKKKTGDRTAASDQDKDQATGEETPALAPAPDPAADLAPLPPPAAVAAPVAGTGTPASPAPAAGSTPVTGPGLAEPTTPPTSTAWPEKIRRIAADLRGASSDPAIQRLADQLFAVVGEAGITGPGAPVVPGPPVASGTPAIPGTPAAPGNPAAPAVPGTPALPGTPAAPGVRGTPAAPGVPGTPAAPQTPATPGTADVPAPPGTARSGSVVPSGTPILFFDDFEAGDLRKWGTCQGAGVNGECAGLDVATSGMGVAQDPEKGKVAEFRVKSGVTAEMGGERSEVREDGPQVATHEGDDRWYQWSMKFPADFPKPSGDYFIVMQWHHKGTSGSPPLAIDVSKGDVVIGGDGLKDAPRKTIGPIHPGKWVDYTMHVKFSRTDGFVEAWENNVRTVPLTKRPTMVDEEDYLKMGIYRDEGGNGTAEVFFDDLSIHQGAGSGTAGKAGPADPSGADHGSDRGSPATSGAANSGASGTDPGAEDNRPESK